MVQCKTNPQNAAGRLYRTSTTRNMKALSRTLAAILVGVATLLAPFTASATFIVPQGGTGLQTVTTGSLLVGAGTSALTLIAPGSSGNVLKSNGTAWVSGVFTPSAAGSDTQVQFNDGGSVAGNAALLFNKTGALLTATNATTTNFSSTYASSTRAVFGQVTIAALSGFLKATAGAISTATISLTADITGILPEANGGTNQSTYATGDMLYATGANTLGKLTTGTANNGKVIAVANGIPTVVATTTFSGVLVYSAGNVTCPTCGTGSGTLTAVSVASSNGFTGSSSGGATPILTLATSITGLLKGNGTAISAAALTDFPSQAAGTVIANGTGGSAVPTAVATSSIFGAGTGGQIIAWNNGVPQWVATTTFSAPLSYSAGAVSCATCLTANQSITLSGVTTGSGSTAITTAWGSAANGVLANPASGSAVPSFVATSTLKIALSDTTGVLTYDRGGTAQSSYAKGDIVYASAANTLSKLTVGVIGTNGVLGVTSGAPAWVATSSLNIAATDLTGVLAETHGGTNQSSYSTGDMLYASGSNTLSKLTTGTANNGKIIAILSGIPTLAATTTFSSPLNYSAGGVTLGTVTEGTGGTNQTTYAKGDMLYASAVNTLGKLTVGTGGQILASLNGIPTWVASTTISNISAMKQAVNYTTTAALAANTYSAGVLTEVGTGALSVDGASPSVSQRILVKDEATQTNNGIYTVTATGSGIAAYVLTRATDYNTNDEIYPGVASYTLSGTANGTDTFVLTSAAPVTLDTSNLTYAEQATGGIALPITVANGGTGGSTFTVSRLLYGNGTAALSSVATTTFTVSTGLNYTGTMGAVVGGASGSLTLATIAQGTALANAATGTNIPVAIATSTWFGAGTGGQILAWANGLTSWVGTTTAGTGLTYNGGSPGNFSVNSSQSIATLSNLTTNGFVYTSGAAGTLNVQTFPGTIAQGMTGTTTFASNGLAYFDSGNTRLTNSSALTYNGTTLTNTSNTTLGGTITFSALTGGTNCLHVNSSGVVSATSGDCGVAGAGLQTLGGQYSTGQTGNTQTFSTTTATTNGLTPSLIITSATNNHQFAISLSGTLSEGGGGTNQSTYTKGDILYASAANTLSKLNIGTGGQILGVVSGIPGWVGTTTAGTGLTYNGGSPGNFSVNSSQSIATLSNLTTNGFVYTSGAAGTLNVQTFPGTVAQGMTGSTTAASNGIFYYDSGNTRYTNSSALNFNGTNFGLASSTPTQRFSVGTLGSDFYIDTTGKVVGYDTTNAWEGRISPTHSFVLSTATTTSWTASTTATAYSPYLVMPFSGTLRQMYCLTDTSFLGVNVQVNGSNATPSYFVASTTSGNIAFTAGNTFTKGQKILINVGTTTTSLSSSISCTGDFTETP